MTRITLLTLALSLPTIALRAAEPPQQFSGIYPSLAMFNNEGECGTGAVVPWADRLWAITYAPHMPKGSSDKLYEITADLTQIIRSESVGGTPANRMIHAESQQLFIGPYVIDANRNVRVIGPDKMFGRLTGLARHLTDPAGKIVYATMEEGIYEVDVKTLAVTELWADEQCKQGQHADLPGYHGKGFYSTQGRYIYANNGDHAKEALKDPAVPSGVLAQWDGKADKWTVVRRNQFTDITGPDGITGGSPDGRVWSIGWDHRSLILMLLEKGEWHAYRLPKSSHSYDGAHGWNTEWPRIREIGEDSLLMTMHGAFWHFPKDFSLAHSAGIAPRSNYLKVIGDFCRWQDRLVMGCDDAAKSEFLNKHELKGELAGPGQSQSNLWFMEPAKLDAIGPALGRGAVWMKEAVKANQPSDPFMFSGWSQRSLLLANDGDEPVTVNLEVDKQGSNEWTAHSTIVVPAHGSIWTGFKKDDTGAWLRCSIKNDAPAMTAVFHYRNDDGRSTQSDALFDGVARPGDKNVSGGLMLARGNNLKTLRWVDAQQAEQCYDLDAKGKAVIKPVADTKGAQWTAENAKLPKPIITSDAASVLYVDHTGKRWRLPKGDAAFDSPTKQRICREICTERNLLNIHGSFYELPAENAGGFPKLRPVTTHNRSITDYTCYRGLLVLSGLKSDAEGEHIVRSEDGKCILWLGAVDDLWKLGKPRGVGGPWAMTAVKKDEPSDPYLVTGYDKKTLILSQHTGQPATVRIEADFTCDGTWRQVFTVAVKPGEESTFTFPEAFGAYWLRLVSDQDATLSATLRYE